MEAGLSRYTSHYSSIALQSKLTEGFKKITHFITVSLE